MENEYYLYLKNKEGNADNFKVYGRALQQGESFVFSLDAPSFKSMLNYGRESSLPPEEVRRLQNMFNKREYKVGKVMSCSSEEDGKLLIKLLKVEAEQI